MTSASPGEGSKRRSVEETQSSERFFPRRLYSLAACNGKKLKNKVGHHHIRELGLTGGVVVTGGGGPWWFARDLVVQVYLNFRPQGRPRYPITPATLRSTLVGGHQDERLG